MLGRQHAWSGLAAGCWIAALLAPHQAAAAVPIAVCVAGYAIVPDLDCDGATATRMLGWLSYGLHEALASLSEVAFRHTATPWDRRSDGRHRHLTHAPSFCLLLGLLAFLSSWASPWCVAAWLGLGIVAAAAAIGSWLIPVSLGMLAAPLLAGHVTLWGELAGAGGWIGPAVTLGCLVHIAGDGVTVTGIPALWPIRFRRRRWYRVHLLPRKIRLHTGLRFERQVIAPLLVAATAWSAWAMVTGDEPAAAVPVAAVVRQ